MEESQNLPLGSHHFLWLGRKSSSESDCDSFYDRPNGCMTKCHKTQCADSLGCLSGRPQESRSSTRVHLSDSIGWHLTVPDRCYFVSCCRMRMKSHLIWSGIGKFSAVPIQTCSCLDLSREQIKDSEVTLSTWFVWLWANRDGLIAPEPY